MDAKYLAEIKAREQAATPGPWKVGISAMITDGNGHALFFGEGAKANAEFIAHARADIPALIAEVERLRGVESELAYEKRANEAIPGVNSLINRSVDKIKKLKAENATLKKALMESVKCFNCSTCCYGRGKNCKKYPHENCADVFIRQAQEQEATTC